MFSVLFVRETPVCICEGRDSAWVGGERQCEHAQRSDPFRGSEDADLQHDELGLHMFPSSVALCFSFLFISVVAAFCIHEYYYGYCIRILRIGRRRRSWRATRLWCGTSRMPTRH
jgi:hypothetical protein